MVQQAEKDGEQGREPTRGIHVRVPVSHLEVLLRVGEERGDTSRMVRLAIAEFVARHVAPIHVATMPDRLDERPKSTLSCG